MALDGTSCSFWDYVILDTIADYGAWCHVALGTVSLYQILTLSITVHIHNSIKVWKQYNDDYFVGFMGNIDVTFKNYTQKELRDYINLMRSHFS